MQLREASALSTSIDSTYDPDRQPSVSVVELIEQPEPGAPFGAKGMGEPPTISSTAAIAAAIRNATGLALTRVPIRPDDIALADVHNSRGPSGPFQSGEL